MCSINYPQEKNPAKSNRSGCLTRNRTYYVTSRQRIITGKELMIFQGFPRNIRASRETHDPSSIQEVTDDGLSALAGNTIGVPAVAALMLAAFSHIDFSRSHGSPPGPHHNTCEEPIRIVEHHGRPDAADDSASDHGDVDDGVGSSSGCDSWLVRLPMLKEAKASSTKLRTTCNKRIRGY
jgi:hypothetical protein